ncbi:hypothetical protein GOBAR_DD11744 [Gossypium barbadense]|nr:hypothetical protein GOBAR_DD11744 [Gossypium barbadense]
MFFLYHTSFSFITTTNFCPPNFALPSDNGGWCNPRWPHFDLAMPMFLKIAEYCTGIVPISFQCILLSLIELSSLRYLDLSFN